MAARPDEMRPQHLARFGVSNELHKTLRVPDGPAICCGAVVSLAHPQTLLLHLSLGQPHARHLREAKTACGMAKSLLRRCMVGWATLYATVRASALAACLS